MPSSSVIFVSAFGLGLSVGAALVACLWWYATHRAKLKADLAVVESTAAQVAKDLKK